MPSTGTRTIGTAKTFRSTRLTSPVHPVVLRGRLRDWVGRDEIMVNSLHGQGIARLAKGLKPEAFAEDGLIEAVADLTTRRSAWACSGTPSLSARANEVSTALFRRFGAAAKGIRP